MVYGRYMDTFVGRIYLAVENGNVVRLTKEEAESGDMVVDEDGAGEEKNLTSLKREADEKAPEVSKRGGEGKVLEASKHESEEKSLAALDRAAEEIREYLDGKRTEFDIPVCAPGTPFQKKVWNALCQIPYGETRTYGEIARLVGSPKGARAVGMACGRNPIMVLVPCHRVIGSTGKLVGFGGGLPMKESLLNLENREGK